MKPREKIKELRKNPKISQQGLANKLNVPGDHIKSFESGKQKVISDELALALEKEYKIPFKWWKTGEGDMYLNELSPEEKEITIDPDTKEIIDLYEKFKITRDEELGELIKQKISWMQAINKKTKQKD